MVDQSKKKHGGIGWCRFTSNPLRAKNRKTGKVGWSCVMINPLCTYCYAASINARYGTMDAFTKPGMENVEHFLDEGELKKWLHLQRKIEMNGQFCKCTHQRIDHVTGVTDSRPCNKCDCLQFDRVPCYMFPFDMTDAFGEWVSFEWLDRIFAHMALCPDIIFQTLTKRPGRALEWFKDNGTTKYRVDSIMKQISPRAAFPGWPLPNIHFGVSAGTTKTCLELIPLLRKIPAHRRWVSVEPLLDSCERDFVGSGRSAILCPHCGGEGVAVSPDAMNIPHHKRTPEMYFACPVCHGVKIDQVVIGGESGSSFRPMQIEWAERIAADCNAAGVKVWMKQLSGRQPAKGLKDFPESLRVREWVS